MSAAAEGMIGLLEDAKSGKTRKEVLDEVDRISREKRECERKNQQLETQIEEMESSLEAKDARISELESKAKAQSKALSGKDSEITSLKVELEYQKKKSGEYLAKLKAARKDTGKLQKNFRIIKKIAFLPKPAEEDD